MAENHKKAPPIRLIMILVLLGFLATILFLKYGGKKDEPPPPPRRGASVSDDFYQGYQKSLGPLAKAKVLFLRGRGLIGGESDTPLSLAAENFALALENLDRAKDLLHVDAIGLKPEEKQCRENLAETFKKYQESVKVFNEYARAQHQGEDAKSGKFALRDGAAKWEKADTLMTELLRDGCNGQYFLWVKKQKIEVRDEAFDDYRQIYGSKFEVQREDFSRLMDASGTP